VRKSPSQSNLTIRGLRPPKVNDAYLNIAYCPYFQKMYQFPSLISSKFINFPPNWLFLLNKRFLLSPYFDHDAFMRHALHVCYWTPLSAMALEIRCMCSTDYPSRFQQRISYRIIVLIWESLLNLESVCLFSWHPLYYLDCTRSSLCPLYWEGRVRHSFLLAQQLSRIASYQELTSCPGTSYLLHCACALGSTKTVGHHCLIIIDKNAHRGRSQKTEKRNSLCYLGFGDFHQFFLYIRTFL